MEVPEEAQQNLILVVFLLQPCGVQQADRVGYGPNVHVESHTGQGRGEPAVLALSYGPRFRTPATFAVEHHWQTIETDALPPYLKALLL
jgi:hypothetical protein